MPFRFRCRALSQVRRGSPTPLQGNLCPDETRGGCEVPRPRRKRIARKQIKFHRSRLQTTFALKDSIQADLPVILPTTISAQEETLNTRDGVFSISLVRRTISPSTKIRISKANIQILVRALVGKVLQGAGNESSADPGYSCTTFVADTSPCPHSEPGHKPTQAQLSYLT